MEAKEFIRELVRMCQAQGEICGDCRIHREIGCPLVVPERVDADKLVSAVEKWSEEHPLVTNGVQMEELLPPNTTIREGFKRIFIEVPRDWWDAEHKGEETIPKWKCDNCVYRPPNKEE